MTKIKKFFTRLLLFVVIAAVIIGFAAMMINHHMVNKEKDNIVYAVTEDKDSFSSAEIKKMKGFDGDCIMVLGAGIKDNETPSPMLKDRLDTGIMLYELGAAPKILLTGDNGTTSHNEIHVMLKYVRDAGVPEKDIFCDHAGFSTYDSMYRAKNIFEVEKLIVVTQTYHEYRSLYIAEKLGLKVMGIGSDQEKYSGQAIREIREILARNKDFFQMFSKPKSLLGGDVIPINGSGLKTHGE